MAISNIVSTRHYEPLSDQRTLKSLHAKSWEVKHGYIVVASRLVDDYTRSLPRPASKASRVHPALKSQSWSVEVHFGTLRWTKPVHFIFLHSSVALVYSSGES